jgi:hypothetical protein
MGLRQCVAEVLRKEREYMYYEEKKELCFSI